MFPANSNFLIVDDFSGVRALVKQQLLALGFSNVNEATNGKDALSKLDEIYKKGIKVDLIIADWNMPEMNGIDLLKQLKSDSRFKSIPFLMITSVSETERMIKAIVVGVTDYILKPFDENGLSEKLTAIWKRMNTKS